MDEGNTSHSNISTALVFDGYRAWRGPVALAMPHGNQAFTCIWIKNNQLASARTIYNVHVRIQYLHDGTEEFVIQSAGWWYEPAGKHPTVMWPVRIDLDANESQCVPIFMQPMGATKLEPPWPQSAVDDHGGTRPLRLGRWTLLITVTADAVPPLMGKIEFTVYREQGRDHLSIGGSPPMGNAWLPILLDAPDQKSTDLAQPSKLARLWHWVGGSWQWAPLFGAGGTIIKFGEYGVGLFLLALSGFAVSSKIAHWKSDGQSTGQPVRLFGYFIVVVAFVFSALVTLSVKGNDPWSHLPELFAALRTTEPPPSPQAPKFPPPAWLPPSPKSAPTPTATPKPTPFPLVAFLYRDHTIQIHNLGDTDVTFWGTKLDVGPRSMEGPPVSIAKEPYFYYVHSETFEQEVLAKFPDGTVKTVPFYAYLKDSNGRKFTAKCGLRTTVANKTITVETQGLGTRIGWLEF
jgi:hypothetical protein